MKTTILIVLANLLLTACQQTPPSTKITTIEEDVNYKDTNHLTIDTVAAKKWLTQQIQDYFNDKISMKDMTTAQYNAFKTDATNIDLDVDNSLSEEEFIKKYKDTYDLSTHITSIGFLISGQDWGDIKIEKCNFKHVGNTPNTTVFSTIIRDDTFKVKYHRDITIVSENGTYRINDVAEYDEVILTFEK